MYISKLKRPGLLHGRASLLANSKLNMSHKTCYSIFDDNRDCQITIHCGALIIQTRKFMLRLEMSIVEIWFHVATGLRWETVEP